MEEDIKRCKELIKPEHSNWIGITNQTAIENIIKGYRELEEENKKLVKANDNLKATKRIKTYKEIEKHFIPKSKIKEEAEELITDAEDVLDKENYLDNFNGSKEEQKHYYRGYKDAALSILDLLEEE